MSATEKTPLLAEPLSAGVENNTMQSSSGTANTAPPAAAMMTTSFSTGSSRKMWLIASALGFILLTAIVVTYCIYTPSPVMPIPVPDDDDSKCELQLVESIPIGLKYKNAVTTMSTYDSWKMLLESAQQSLDLGTFYWTLRGSDVYNHSTASAGEDIFERIKALGAAGIKVRIAQSAPGPTSADLDTVELAKLQTIEVRSVDFPRLLHGGVLHTKLWLVDNKHFYVGSANMDWRSLTQIKELGIMGVNCPTMAKDLQKIFAAYWYLGNEDATIPNEWSASFSTQYNDSNPIPNPLASGGLYFASSPPPLRAAGRADDLETILSVIAQARYTIDVAVMDYLPLEIYRHPMRFWPYIDDALRKRAIEDGVQIKLLISWWKHSNPIEDKYLRSLISLSSNITRIDIQVKRFIVPADSDQRKIPFARVNHNKYMVTDNDGYIGTSNWAGDYFTVTAGIGMRLKQSEPLVNEQLRLTLENIFKRDWNSEYAKEFK